jgi:hypothetical protein
VFSCIAVDVIDHARMDTSIEHPHPESKNAEMGVFHSYSVVPRVVKELAIGAFPVSVQALLAHSPAASLDIFASINRVTQFLEVGVKVL